MKVLLLVPLKVLPIKQPVFSEGLEKGHGSGVIIITNRTTLEKLAGKSMENQQIGRTASLEREAIIQIPRPMLLSVNQS